MMWFIWKLTHFLTLTQLYCKQHAPVCLWGCGCTSERWWRGGGKDQLTKGWKAAALGCRPLSGRFQTTNKVGREGKRPGKGKHRLCLWSDHWLPYCSKLCLYVSSSSLHMVLILLTCPKVIALEFVRMKYEASEWPQIDYYCWKENGVIACE